MSNRWPVDDRYLIRDESRQMSTSAAVTEEAIFQAAKGHVVVGANERRIIVCIVGDGYGSMSAKDLEFYDDVSTGEGDLIHVHRARPNENEHPSVMRLKGKQGVEPRWKMDTIGAAGYHVTVFSVVEQVPSS